MLNKDELEALYESFNHQALAQEDPLSSVDPELLPEDFEIVSFIVAGLSYGRVEQIQKSCADLWLRLERMGMGPRGKGLRDYLTGDSLDTKELQRALKNWRHRLNTENDIYQLLQRLSMILREHHSLCAFFQSSHHEDPQKHIEIFCASFRQIPISKKSSASKKWKGTGISWFVASPQDGSTCKRLMMWLRWMIRKDHIDPGLWRESPLQNKKLAPPSSSRLFLPVDTHIFQWAQQAKILKAKSPSWKAVLEITEHFKKIHPDDPVRYDFALCHQSMRDFRKPKRKPTRPRGEPSL